MADVNIQHIESTVASVRSTVSTASSGYAIVSSSGRKRGDIRTVYQAYPEEPPPDYDDETTTDKLDSYITPSPAHSRQSNPKQGCESTVPLLSKETVQTDTTTQTIVRINSRSQDINIEIVSNPATSPASTTADNSFLYQPSEQNRNGDRKCCKFTRREKVFFGVVIVLAVILVFVILNFTVCVGNFTSACD